MMTSENKFSKSMIPLASNSSSSAMSKSSVQQQKCSSDMRQSRRNDDSKKKDKIFKSSKLPIKSSNFELLIKKIQENENKRNNRCGVLCEQHDSDSSMSISESIFEKSGKIKEVKKDENNKSKNKGSSQNLIHLQMMNELRDFNKKNQKLSSSSGRSSSDSSEDYLKNKNRKISSIESLNESWNSDKEVVNSTELNKQNGCCMTTGRLVSRSVSNENLNAILTKINVPTINFSKYLFDGNKDGHGLYGISHVRI